MTDGNEFGETNVPRHQASRAANAAKVDCHIGIWQVSVELPQLALHVIDSNLLTTRNCTLNINSIIISLHSQQPIELGLAVLRRVKIHNKMLSVAVLVRKTNLCGVFVLVLGTPDDMLAICRVELLVESLAE